MRIRSNRIEAERAGADLVAPMRHAFMRALIACTAVVVVVSGAAGCASYTAIPDADRARINTQHDGKLMWLKQSLFVGKFYDDDRFELLHPRRFEELTYLQTNEGEAIKPPAATGIIPAGTRVRLERIEWPTGEAVFRRPLYTPRYTTWIYMRVGRDRGDTLLERDGRQILLLPSGVSDEKAFDGWLAQTLGESDPNPWIRSLPRDQQLGVTQKRPVVGMAYEALTAALGFPDRITRRLVNDGGKSRTLEIAIYGAESIVLDNGVVMRVDDPQGRPVSRDAAPMTTSPALPSATSPAVPNRSVPDTAPEGAEGVTPDVTPADGGSDHPAAG